MQPQNSTFNSHGPKFTEMIHLMKTEKLDILAVQETMISTNSKFQLGDYMFITSTNVTDPNNPPQGNGNHQGNSQ